MLPITPDDVARPQGRVPLPDAANPEVGNETQRVGEWPHPEGPCHCATPCIKEDACAHGVSLKSACATCKGLGLPWTFSNLVEEGGYCQMCKLALPGPGRICERCKNLEAKE